MKNQMFRQGDVLLEKVSNTPKARKAKELALGKLGPVLALGEVTGHHHTVVAHPESYNPAKDLPLEVNPKLGCSLAEHAATMLNEMILVGNASTKRKKALSAEMAEKGDPACLLYEGKEENGERTLVVFRPTLLRHEEHPALFLDKGVYKVTKQREFTPQGWINVQD